MDRKPLDLTGLPTVAGAADIRFIALCNAAKSAARYADAPDSAERTRAIAAYDQAARAFRETLSNRPTVPAPRVVTVITDRLVPSRAHTIRAH